MGTEPPAVWYGSIGTAKMSVADQTPNNPNIDVNIEGEVEETSPNDGVDSITSIKAFVVRHTNEKLTLNHGTETRMERSRNSTNVVQGMDKVEDWMESREKQGNVIKNGNSFEEKAVVIKESNMPTHHEDNESTE